MAKLFAFARPSHRRANSDGRQSANSKGVRPSVSEITGILRAEGLPTRHWFKKETPYCYACITIDDGTPFITRSIRGANPRWNKPFDIPLQSSLLHVQIIHRVPVNSKKLPSNKEIPLGSARIPIKDLLLKNSEAARTLILECKQKLYPVGLRFLGDLGSVVLSMRFTFRPISDTQLSYHPIVTVASAQTTNINESSDPPNGMKGQAMASSAHATHPSVHSGGKPELSRSPGSTSSASGRAVPALIQAQDKPGARRPMTPASAQAGHIPTRPRSKQVNHPANGVKPTTTAGSAHASHAHSQQPDLSRSPSGAKFPISTASAYAANAPVQPNTQSVLSHLPNRSNSLATSPASGHTSHAPTPIQSSSKPLPSHPPKHPISTASAQAIHLPAQHNAAAILGRSPSGSRTPLSMASAHAGRTPAPPSDKSRSHRPPDSMGAPTNTDPGHAASTSTQFGNKPAHNGSPGGVGISTTSASAAQNSVRRSIRPRLSHSSRSPVSSASAQARQPPVQPLAKPDHSRSPSGARQSVDSSSAYAVHTLSALARPVGHSATAELGRSHSSARPSITIASTHATHTSVQREGQTQINRPPGDVKLPVTSKSASLASVQPINQTQVSSPTSTTTSSGHATFGPDGRRVYHPMDPNHPARRRTSEAFKRKFGKDSNLGHEALTRLQKEQVVWD